MGSVIFILIFGLVGYAQGHGTVVSPRSRNSVDYLVGVNTPKDWPSNADCANITGDPCHNVQATFWYSQGCFIGCAECDHTSGRRNVDLCGKGMVGTLPEQYRSVNRDSEFGSEYDIYKHNPWRSPGNAPTANACGMAGGTPWPQEGPEAGDYTTTVFAHHGMKGTDLKPLYTGVEWTLGLEAEVTFQISNNHGGGYSYRLCPFEANLTEACFQSHPLEFVTEKQAIYFKNGTVLPIKGSFVTDGTTPAGSMWSMIPIPSTCLGPRCIPSGKPAFEPHCDHCVGNRHDIAVRDVVKVPSDLPPGKYVLGLRYDCEATAQVWNSCSDITLVK